MPPLREGVPASLGKVKKGHSKVKPFPKQFNLNENICRSDLPLSVFRIHVNMYLLWCSPQLRVVKVSVNFFRSHLQIDKCGLLWTPDAGIKNIFAATGVDCPSKLLAYDLNFMKDQQIRK